MTSLLIFHKIIHRWRAEGGYRQVLRLAFPLILSTGSWSLQQFVDRVFLSWYSPQAVAAVTPAGIANFSLFSFFIGTASYVNTFVAQYYGAGRLHRVGAAVWQGMYLVWFAVILCGIIYPFVDSFFHWVGHDPAVQKLESDYFRILLLSAPAVIISNVCSGFFSGIGRPWIIFWVDVIATVINIVFDYLWIFGKGGFAEMGISGAGYATLIAMSMSAILLFILMGRSNYENSYKTRSAWRFEKKLFKRLIRFGAPNGMQFFLEVTAFSVFIFIVGRLGVMELAATNIAFNINSLAFMPMIGMMTAVTVLVGQALGQDRPKLAEKLTYSAFHLCITYFGVLCIGYFFFADIFLAPFSWQAEPTQFQAVKNLATMLLRFVAIYSLFDAMNMIFSAALKGAGDTRFVAQYTILLAWAEMVIPSYVIWRFFQGNIYWLWAAVTAYVMSLGVIFFWRFKRDLWKEMRVIEKEALQAKEVAYDQPSH